MKTGIVRQLLRPDVRFFCLTAATWTSFFFFVRCPAIRLESQVFFVFGAGLLSYLLLRILGHFGSARLLPRKSDVFLMLFVIPVAGYATHLLFALLFSSQVCPLRTIMTWTPLLALTIFGADYLASIVLLKSGLRKKVVLDLMPEERQVLLEHFEALGMSGNLELLTKEDLKQYLLEGAEKELALIIISRAAVSDFDRDATLLRAHLAGIPIIDRLRLSSQLTGRITITDTDMWSYVLTATPQTPLLQAYSKLKIVLDPLLALVLGTLTLPLACSLAVLIKLTSAGPIFYKQVRVGYLGKHFTLIKFRSMYVNSEANGPRWASNDDTRVTPLGRFMRKTRFDELPQLWNVIRGELSFIGPRPERPEIYKMLDEHIPLFPMRTIVRPGITGWAQVFAGYAASIAESHIKLEYDLHYIQHMSPRLDLIILVKTLEVFVTAFVAPSEPRRAQRLAERKLVGATSA